MIYFGSKNDKQRTATINRVGMAQSLQNIYSKENVAKEKVPIKDTNKTKKSNKCSQCNYAYSHPSELIKHLKIHSGEKLNKCNQCSYASNEAGNLKRHSKTHSGENGEHESLIFSSSEMRESLKSKLRSSEQKVPS